MHDRKWLLCLFWTRITRGDAMEDIFVVKRCNKVVIYGRRVGETSHPTPDAAFWYRIFDTRTRGFMGDGFDLEVEAQGVCRQLNARSQMTVPQG